MDHSRGGQRGNAPGIGRGTAGSCEKGCKLFGAEFLGALGLAAILGFPGQPDGLLSMARGESRNERRVSIDFDSEVIRLQVRGDSIEIDGLYRFTCRADSLPFVTMLYPYPVDSLLGGARMVELSGRTPGAEWGAFDFIEVPSAPGALWRIPGGCADSLEVRAVYRQARHARYARYIVTTTRGWGHPLRRARFEIRLPAGARPVRFSHDFRPAGAAGDPHYVYETVDFLPARDITVEWEE